MVFHVLLALSALAGADEIIRPEPPSLFDKQHLGRLKKGMSQREVERLLGRPHFWNVHHGSEMCYTEGGRMMVVDFDTITWRVSGWRLYTLTRAEKGDRKAKLYPIHLAQGRTKDCAWLVWVPREPDKR